MPSILSFIGQLSVSTTNSFSTIQPDFGTSPVATSPTDTLTFTSSDGSVTITGNSATDTINFQLAGGASAPKDATYVTLSTNATLTNERVLTGTSNQVIITDNGAGSTVVLSLPQSIATGSSPTFTGLTLSGLTQGSVLFAGSGGLISQDNANFFWDNTNDCLVIGQNTASLNVNSVAINAKLTVDMSSDLVGVMNHMHNNTAAVASNYILGRTRGTPGSPTIVQTGDTIGIIAGYGYTGNATVGYQKAAQIRFEVATSGTISTTSMPGRITFYTTPDTTVIPARAMLVDSDKTITMDAYGTGIAHFSSAGLISSSLIVNADVSASAAISYSKLNLTGSIVNADINASAAIAITKIANGTANQLIKANAGATANEFATLSGGTGLSVTFGSGTISLGNTGVTSLVATANQTTVSAATGAVTIGTVQNIGTGSSPTFSGLTLSSFTSGSIIFADGGGVLTQDNTNLFFDDTNNVLRVPSIVGGTAVSSNLDLNPSSAANFTTGKVRVGSGAGDYGANTSVVLELLPNGASIGVASGSGIGGISLGSTIKQTANTVYGLPFIQLFKAFPTYQPSTSSVTSLSACVIFYDTKTVDNAFNTSGTTIGGYTVWSVPVYSATGGGTNVVGENAGLHCGLTVNSGATVTNHFAVDILDPGGAGSVTNCIGINVQALTKGGTSNVAFKSAVASGTGKWCLLSSGSAASAHLGQIRLGSTTAPSHGLHLTNSLGLTRTTVSDAAYSVVGTDVLVAYTALTAARTVTLQAAATAVADKTLFIIDETGKADEFPITIDGNGSETIDGVANLVINNKYGSVGLVTNGTGWVSIVKPSPVQLLNRDFTITSISNTTTETTMFTYTVLGGTLGKSRMLRLTLVGHGLFNRSAGDTLRIRAKYGATVCYDATHTAAATSANERPFKLTFLLAATNATNAQEATGHSLFGTAVGVAGVGGAVADDFLGHHHTVAEDSTADKTLVVTAQLSASANSLTFETHTVQLELL